MQAGQTFMDKRRAHVRAQIEQYGGDAGDDKVQRYVDMWVAGSLRQVEVEMIIANDHGATTEELAEQFEYSNYAHASGALRAARKKVEEGRAHR